MIKKINHVAIVGKSNEETASLFTALFGFKVVESNEVPEQGFKSTLISKEDVSFELIEPIGSEGAIAKFLEKRGSGLHHVSLQVDDMDQTVEQLKAKSVKLIGETPQQVTETSRVIFIHPSSTGGILIELIESS
jgi:methylmalonyl-CoA/ethylmalonyl-CoA epimerase